MMGLRSRARLIAGMVITLLALVNTVHQMIEQTRLIDWIMLVIEAAVLLLIAYEVGVNYCRYRVETKQKERRNKILAVLSDFMFRGQTIQHNVPTPNDMGTVITDWIALVAEWRIEVSQYLAETSSRAESAFSLISDSHQSGDHVFHHTADASFYVTGLVAQSYRPLIAYLSNLRSIMEKPEIYF